MTDNDFNDRKLITDLASASFREQRARRRWGVFFKFIFFAYIITITVLVYRGNDIRLEGNEQYAAVVQINGVIASGGPNAANTINKLLRDAFDDKGATGIIVEINSPGGSAVESNRIYNEIRRLREKHPDKKLIAVAGDLCASGGYYIAAAADEIYADPASIIGSIGVIYSSFGFVDAMEKLGVKRRVLTAGGSKNILDPFSPESFEDQRIMTDILDDVHEVFQQAVRAGRGDRLQAYDERIFSGALFSGEDSITLGLIDGYNDTGGVARDLFEVEHVRYYRQGDWLDDIVGKFSILAPTQRGIMAVSGQ